MTDRDVPQYVFLDSVVGARASRRVPHFAGPRGAQIVTTTEAPIGVRGFLGMQKHKRTKQQETKVPITLRALVARLKRRFARDGETFHVTRGGDERAYNSDLGQWYTTDNNVLRSAWHSLDALVEMARECGVLRSYEEVIA